MTELNNLPGKRSRLRQTSPQDPQAGDQEQTSPTSPPPLAVPETQKEPEPLATAVPAPQPVIPDNVLREAFAPAIPVGSVPVHREPPAGMPLGNSPFHQHDVVQILDETSRHYGGFLIIGDVLGNRVHGYCVSEGRKQDYITVPLNLCWYIGRAKMRSKTPCSPKWISDRGGLR